MDKKTFYKELTERLVKLGLPNEYIDSHIAQFDGYFSGKNDSEISLEIEKLGDLDKVARRIKRMTDKAINGANPQDNSENEHRKKAVKHEEKADEAVVNVENTENYSDSAIDDDVTVFEDSHHNDFEEAFSEDFEYVNDDHATKRGRSLIRRESDNSLADLPVDQKTMDERKKKFMIIFFSTLPITIAVILATVGIFGFVFCALAMVILLAIGGLVFVTAAGTLISVFGLIFGASQMLTSVPVGLYECGVSIMIGAFALALGVLVYNFAVRLMPYAARWLLVFVKYVIRKYRELYVHLKKEWLGL